MHAAVLRSLMLRRLVCLLFVAMHCKCGDAFAVLAVCDTAVAAVSGVVQFTRSKRTATEHDNTNNQAWLNDFGSTSVRCKSQPFRSMMPLVVKLVECSVVIGVATNLPMLSS